MAGGGGRAWAGILMRIAGGMVLSMVGLHSRESCILVGVYKIIQPMLFVFTSDSFHSKPSSTHDVVAYC